MRRVWFGILIGVFTPSQHAFACKFFLPPIAPVHDPKGIHLAFPARAVALSETPWGPQVAPIDLAKYFHPPSTPQTGGFLPIGYGAKHFEAAVRAFAKDTLDERSVTFESPWGDGTTIKLHLVTGELLVLSPRKEVGVFTKLPVGERAVGKNTSTAQLFSHLAEPVGIANKKGVKGNKFPRLSSGESFTYQGFTSLHHLREHVDKHVLGVPPQRFGMSVREKNSYASSKQGSRGLEFEKLRTVFVSAVAACRENVVCEEIAYANLSIAYDNAAEAFLKSNGATCLTYTQVQERKFDGANHAMGYRFNVLTREFAVFDREAVKIHTYFKVDLEEGNRLFLMKDLQQVNSPIEYFFMWPVTRL